jgi:tetratricopeptide (TPR) repeat protein
MGSPVSPFCDMSFTPVLNMISDALENNDPDFALTLCRNAMALVAHPKLMVYAGEANEAKGDVLTAMACYRAALTIDPERLSVANLDESRLAEINARAEKLLSAAAKKLGVEERWGKVEKKDLPVTASKIEQFIRTGLIDQALLHYRRSAEFKESKDCDFHLQVGRAFRQAKMRSEAIEALALSTQCGEHGEMNGAYELGDLYYEVSIYTCQVSTPGNFLISPLHRPTRTRRRSRGTSAPLPPSMHSRPAPARPAT